MKKGIILVLILLLVLTACFNKGKPEGASTDLQTLSFEFRFNLLEDDPANNYFAWTLERTGANGAREKRVVKDTLDPARTTVPQGLVDMQTGASVFLSTFEFNRARNDIHGRSVFPGSLRGLLLFAVSPWSYVIDEDLRVEKDGKKLTFFWTHHATSHMLWTDENGKIDLSSCSATLTTCDRAAPGIIRVKPEFLKDGADASNRASIDWEKVIPNMNTSSLASTDFHYTGKTTAEYNNGIILIKGDLVLEPKE
ncbi:MAG: hypothetical protein FWD26_00285 [Treponema sp.]|nr:hypothetical protein [Treponema sp.]